MKIEGTYPKGKFMLALIIGLLISCGVGTHSPMRESKPELFVTKLPVVPLKGDTIGRTRPLAIVSRPRPFNHDSLTDLYRRTIKAYEAIDTLGRVMPQVLNTMNTLVVNIGQLRRQNDSLRTTQATLHEDVRKYTNEAHTSKRQVVTAKKEIADTRNVMDNMIFLALILCIFCSVAGTYLNHKYLKKYGHRFSTL